MQKVSDGGEQRSAQILIHLMGDDPDILILRFQGTDNCQRIVCAFIINRYYLQFVAFPGKRGLFCYPGFDERLNIAGFIIAWKICI